MKYIIYCRKSTDEDNNQVQSLETQKRITEDIAQKATLEVIDILYEARSAKTPNNRPLFTSMLKRIQAGEAQGIIVAHIDRLSRNGTESANIVNLIEQGYLKEIRTSYKIYNTIQDILYMDFDFVFASHFSRNLSIRVKEGIITKLNRGEYPNRAPIGYINKQGKIYPDPEKSHYIKSLFTLFSSGNYSLRQITQYFYSQGLRSRDSGLKVQKSIIHHILTNTVYYGVIRVCGKLYTGIHEPLVSKQTFDQVQAVLSGRNNVRKQKHDFLFRGYMVCADCGCMLTATIKKERYVYYYCTNGRGKHIPPYWYMNQDYVAGLFNNLISGLEIPRAKMEEAFEAYSRAKSGSMTNGSNTRSLLSKQIGLIDVKQKRLLDLYINGSIEQSIYDQKHKELLNEKTQLEIQLKNYQDKDPLVTLELIEKFKNSAVSLQNLWNTKDELIRRDLLKSLLWNCKIKDREIASVQYKRPYEKLAEVAKNPNFDNLYPQSDSNR